MGADVSELVGLADHLSRASVRLAGASSDALQTAARQVESAAKAAAPEDTGTLKESIHIVPMATAGSVTITADARYAVFVEFGTSKMAAQPFMFPAAESAQDALATAFEQAAVAAIDG